jgi:hypothetical protein
LREWRERAEAVGASSRPFRFSSFHAIARRMPRRHGAVADRTFKTAGKTGRPETMTED